MELFNPRRAVSMELQGTAVVVTRLPQLFAVIFRSRDTRSFYIKFRQNYPACGFFSPARNSAALQCIAGQ